MKHPFQVNKILIPVDFSKTSKLALEHAAHLCTKFGAELYLLHVYTSNTADVLPNITATNPTSSDFGQLKDFVIDELESIGKNFHSKYGVNYNLEVRDGSVGKEISKTAKEVKADLIVMGTHGVSGFEEFFLGSNAYRTVTSATIPVLTVQEHSDKLGFKNIVLPIDGTQHTRDKVSQAVTIAKAFDSTIHIAALVNDGNIDDKKVFNLKIKQIQEHLENKGVNFETSHIEGDNIAEATLEFAKKINADLTVIMTDQENYTGFFMGPYAQRIVNHSRVPVLSVTPIGTVEGFSQSTLGGDYKPFYI